jgi:hypothetical protein
MSLQNFIQNLCFLKNMMSVNTKSCQNSAKIPRNSIYIDRNLNANALLHFADNE